MLLQSGGVDVCGGDGCDSREVVTDSQRLEQELSELDDPDVEPERDSNTLEPVNDSTGIGNNKSISSEGVVSPHVHIASGDGLDVTITVKAG